MCDPGNEPSKVIFDWTSCRKSTDTSYLKNLLTCCISSGFLICCIAAFLSYRVTLGVEFMTFVDPSSPAFCVFFSFRQSSRSSSPSSLLLRPSWTSPFTSRTVGHSFFNKNCPSSFLFKLVDVCLFLTDRLRSIRRF